MDNSTIKVIVEQFKGSLQNIINRLQIVETRGATIPAVAQQSLSVPSYTVAGLPTVVAGMVAYATNGRKAGEGAGLGTGVFVYCDASNWLRGSDDTTVLA